MSKLVGNLQETKPLLEFQKVSRTFPTYPGGPKISALDSVSFPVPAGRIVGLIGPNGSGKTTAFRVAAGLLKPHAGRVILNGQPPGTAAGRRLTGYLPEDTGLPGTLTPAEILRFVAALFGFSAAQRNDRIEELDQLLDLARFMKKPIRRLSKGMARRLGLATALFNRPRLLLLDEPLEGLDPLNALRVKEHLRERAGDGCAVLISSHILADIETICGSIVLLHEGRVLLQGDREAILADPDQIEIRFQAPDRGAVLEQIRTLIEQSGGSLSSSGHPGESLESLFQKILGKNP